MTCLNAARSFAREYCSYEYTMKLLYTFNYAHKSTAQTT